MALGLRLCLPLQHVARLKDILVHANIKFVFPMSLVLARLKKFLFTHTTEYVSDAFFFLQDQLLQTKTKTRFL